MITLQLSSNRGRTSVDDVVGVHVPRGVQQLQHKVRGLGFRQPLPLLHQLHHRLRCPYTKAINETPENCVGQRTLNNDNLRDSAMK